MKKLMSIIMLTVMFYTLVACSSKGSYAVIPIVNGKEYYGQETGEPDDYTLKNKGASALTG